MAAAAYRRYARSMAGSVVVAMRHIITIKGPP
jgi:hypothetical protein